MVSKLILVTQNVNLVLSPMAIGDEMEFIVTHGGKTTAWISFEGSSRK